MDVVLSQSQPLILLAAIILSAVPHEMMHAAVAYRLGDDLAHSEGRISLNPMKHIDPVLTVALPILCLLLQQGIFLAAKPVPINTSRVRGGENGLALIGIAGPLTNLALAAAISVPINAMEPSGGLLYSFLATFFLVNIALAVFNLLPIPPLDGSRVLYAIAPRPIQQFMEQVESFGIFIVFIIIFVFGSAIFPLIESANKFFINLFIG